MVFWERLFHPNLRAAKIFYVLNIGAVNVKFFLKKSSRIGSREKREDRMNPSMVHWHPSPSRTYSHPVPSFLDDPNPLYP